MVQFALFFSHCCRIMFFIPPVLGLFRVWVNWMAALTNKELYFTMEMILGTITGWFLVSCFRVPGCSGNGSGVCPYLWVSEKIIRFGQITQNAGLCPAEFLIVFNDSTFNLFKNLCDVSVLTSRNGRVPWLGVPRMFFLLFPWNDCHFSLFFSKLPSLWKQNAQQ